MERAPRLREGMSDPDPDDVLRALRSGGSPAFAALTEVHRGALRSHCYRMLGSLDEAEDLVQETLLRAWRARAGFEGRSTIRTWLLRIATNVCLNARARGPRRVLPADVVPPVTAATPASEARSTPPVGAGHAWVQPFPDALLGPEALRPDTRIAQRESVALAFVAALQVLPARQRAALLLTDVLGWSAAEAAEGLDTTVVAVHSAVQRARASLRGRGEPQARGPVEAEVLRRYVAAWEADDVKALVALLRDDARWEMPPAPLWFHGKDAIADLLRRYPPSWRGRSFRLMPLGANGQPAAAVYLREAGAETFTAVGVHVLSVEGGRIAQITAFGADLCKAFGLAATLDR